MADTENTVYEAVRPIQIFTKILGSNSQTEMQSSGDKFNVFGTIHVVLILMLKVWLIYYNLDPSKFSKVTNSTILNSGLWIQTLASLVMSTLFILIQIRKRSHKWKLLQHFHEIDLQFSKYFFIKYHYVQAKHWIALFVVFGVIIHFVLISITTYYTWNLPFELWHKLSILIAIYFSNICIYSITNQFLCAQLYLLARFRNVNDILSQLIFDEPNTTGLMFNENQASVDGKFVKQMQRKRMGPNERTGKSSVAYIDSVNSYPIQINYSFDKEFPRIIKSVAGSNTESVRRRKAAFTPFSTIACRTIVTKFAFTRSSSVADVINKLDKLMGLHDRLCDCVDLCNYLLALQILLIVLTICVYIVFGLFAKYRVWMEYQYEAANVAQMNIYWIAVYCFFSVVSTNVSSKLMQTIQETAIVIHRVACRNEDSVLLDKLSQISQMLHSRKTTIGYGLIVFDWSTVFTFICSLLLHYFRRIKLLKAFLFSIQLFGSVCMYLIILIQFYISGRSHKIQQPNQNNETSVA